MGQSVYPKSYYQAVNQCTVKIRGNIGLKWCFSLVAVQSRLWLVPSNQEATICWILRVVKGRRLMPIHAPGSSLNDNVRHVTVLRKPPRKAFLSWFLKPMYSLC